MISYVFIEPASAGSMFNFLNLGKNLPKYCIQDNVDIALKQIQDLEMGKAPVATGLLNGYAGEGMIRLAALDQANISWVNLL